MFLPSLRRRMSRLTRRAKFLNLRRVIVLKHSRSITLLFTRTHLPREFLTLESSQECWMISQDRAAGAWSSCESHAPDEHSYYFKLKTPQILSCDTQNHPLPRHPSSAAYRRLLLALSICLTSVIMWHCEIRHTLLKLLPESGPRRWVDTFCLMLNTC